MKNHLIGQIAKEAALNAIVQSYECTKNGNHYYEVTRTPYSVKSPAIWLFIKQLMWTHIKETSKSALLDLREWNSPLTDEFPAQRAS